MDTKSLFTRFVIAIALISMALPIPGRIPALAETLPELVVNGGFESGNTSPWQGLDSTQLVTGSANSGNYAVKIASEREVSQNGIPVTPGKTYQLTAWFKWVEFAGSTTGNDRLRIIDADASEIGVLNGLHTQTQPGIWNKLTLTVTPKSGTISVIFGLSGPQEKVELYFDDISLIGLETAAPQPMALLAAPENLLANGDFETGGVVPWESITDANLITGDANSGSRSVKITTNLEAAQGWIPVTAGATYELTAWYKWNEYSGSNWGYDRLRVVNYDWSEAGVLNRLTTLYPKGQWTKLTLTFKPTTSNVKVSFGLFGPQDKVEIYFDNLSLRSVDPNNPAPTAAPTATAAVPTATVAAPTATVKAPTAAVPTATAAAPTVAAPTAVPATPTTVAGPVGNNLVPNGDFENGSTSWSGLTAANIVNSGVYSGANAAKFSFALEGQSDWITVTPGQSYTLSAWYKWLDYAGANWGYDRLRVVNYDWSELASANVLHAKYPKGSWNLVSINFTPKSDKIRVSMGQFGPQDRVDIYFDALTLSSGTGGQPPAPTQSQPTATRIPNTATPGAPTAVPTKPTVQATPTLPAATPTKAPTAAPTTAPTNPPTTQLPGVRTINMPYLNSSNILNDRYTEMGIFWFGKVTSSQNYTDVRIAYNDKAVVIQAGVFDRLFNYDTDAILANLTKNDAVSIYINTGAGGSTINAQSFRLVGGLNWFEDHKRYQTAFQGNNGSWQASTLSFTSLQGFRGAHFNDNQENRGWVMSYEIPYTSLGLSGRPADGSVWNMAVVVHDKDGSTLNADIAWPESFSNQNPSTWGRLRFGMPAFSAAKATGSTTVTIRHKLDGATVVDAGVGGDINGLCPDSGLWDAWGNRNFQNQNSVNIQNQSDVGDWPCFSKFYVTFPLSKIPAGKVIISAKLQLFEWGGSDFAQAKPSLIQVSTVNGDWSESTLNWNNAPMPLENVAQTWVNPMSGAIQWPGVKYEWDVSRAVAQSYGSSAPLRLSLYSADTAYHSGKFFSTSNADDWNAAARPTLIIVWGNPAP